MIYKDINTSGVMTLKLFGNELSATSLGIVVIFMGVVTLIGTIRWRVSERTERVPMSDAVKKNGNSVEFGKNGSTEQNDYMMKEVSEIKANK